MLTFQWCTFDELTNAQLYDILALRQQVFVIEQRCIYIDLDYLDQKAKHLLGTVNNQLVTYLRVFEENVVHPKAASLGRVITSSKMRNQGYSKKTILEAFAKIRLTSQVLVISAQLYLQKFYESLGFHATSEPYMEDGIAHIKMRIEFV